MDVEKDSRNGRVRLNLVITKQLDDMLERFANANGTNKSDILRKALALYEVANDAKEHGNRLGIVSKDRKVLTEIVGL
jgi:anti-sigma regulatory factor (Ser/Thr protein kinase)